MLSSAWRCVVVGACLWFLVSCGAGGSNEQSAWTDREGDRAPAANITSYDDWCELSDVTMIQVGQNGADGRFFRDPRGTLSESLRAPFLADAQLPGDATDTGFSRDGRRLWLGSDGLAAFLVSESDPADIDRWSSETERLSCAG